MNALEHFLIKYYHGRSCTLFARGSTGLYALFKALHKINESGEVIIPAICCETIPIAAIYAGIKPVIADVDKDNLCLSYNSVLQKLSHNTLAIVLVYIYGNLFDTTPYQELQTSRDIILIEDIAQSVGGHSSGQEVGQRFDFTLLSFANDKIIKGRGGAIVQRNPHHDNILQSMGTSFPPPLQQHALQQKQQSLRNMVHALYDLAKTNPTIDISQTFYAMLPYYKDVIIRYSPLPQDNYILSQVKDLPHEQKMRYEKYKYYEEHIDNQLLKVIQFAPGAMCWRLPILIRDPVNTFYITTLLRENGILASNHYFPLDKLLGSSPNPNSANVGSRILNLWVDDKITMSQVEKTVDLLNSYRAVT
jgi:dTDP-4-amino-4,6-dideoxygalactose transaminase